MISVINVNDVPETNLGAGQQFPLSEKILLKLLQQISY